MFHCLFSIYSTPTCCNNRVVWTDGTIHCIFNLYESCISVLAGWVLLNQKLSIKELLGCVIMFAAIILAQLPEKEKDNK